MHLFWHQRLVVGLYIGTTTFKNCLAVYTNKVKRVYVLAPCNFSLWYVTETSGNHPSVDMHRNVHKCVIPNSPNWIQFKCPSIRLWYIHSVLLHSNKKEWTPVLHNMHGSYRYIKSKGQVQKSSYSMFTFLWSSKGAKLLYGHRCEIVITFVKVLLTGRMYEKTCRVMNM